MLVAVVLRKSGTMPVRDRRIAQVWDVVGGTCVQTIENAHASVIMGLIQWQVCVCSTCTNPTLCPQVLISLW